MALYELGPSGYDGGGKYFSEKVLDVERVKEILVGVGDCIESIQLRANSGRYLERHGGSGGKLQRFVLAEDERIMEIRGEVIFGVLVKFSIGKLQIITESRTFTVGVNGGDSIPLSDPKVGRDVRDLGKIGNLPGLCRCHL